MSQIYGDWRPGADVIKVRDRREVVAYHEAGHAVMAALAGFRVVTLDIKAVDNRSGALHFVEPVPPTKEQALLLALVAMSGAAADYIHWNKNNHTQNEDVQGDMTDRSHAAENLSKIGYHDVNLMVVVAISAKYLEISEIWNIVDSVAKKLLKYEELSAEDIRKLNQLAIRIPSEVIQSLESALQLQ